MAYIGNSPVQDETVSSAQIIDGAIVNADINSSAAIALSKTALVAGTGITLSTNTLNLDASQTGFTSLLNASLVAGRDADNQVKFSTDDQIIFRVAGGDGVTMKASGEIEATSLDISGDVDVDGTLETDALTINGSALNYKAFGTSSIMFGDTTTGTIDAANYNTGLGVDIFASLTTGDSNVAIGYGALKTEDTNSENTAVGAEALMTQNGADGNTAVGFRAGYDLTTGAGNAFFGAEAAANIVGGTDNVVIGKGALATSTDLDKAVIIGRSAAQTGDVTSAADGTVAIGYESLKALTTGQANTAIGYQSLDAEDDGDYSTAVGYQALTAQTGTTGTVGNTAVGYQAAAALTSATSTTAIGYKAGGTGIMTGSDNTLIGRAAGYALVGGDSNTIVGFEAGLATTAGTNMTIIGRRAGYANLESGAAGTVALGYESCYSLTSGAKNTGLGYRTLKSTDSGSNNAAVGHRAGHAISNGGNNVCIGVEAGGHDVNLTTGDYNTVIGSLADVSTADAQNEIVIGYNVTGQGSNTAVIGNDSLSAFYVSSDAGATIHGGRLALGLARTDPTSFLDVIGGGAAGPTVLIDNTQAPNRLAELRIDGDNGSGDGGAMVSLYRDSGLKWSYYTRNNTIVGSAFSFALLDAGNDDGVYINQGGSGWTDASDERLKTSFVPIENAVDKLNTLQAINFKWKYGSEERQTKNNIGLLAQEVYEVFPEAVDYHDPDDFKLIDHPTIEGTKQAQSAWGIDKSKLIPVLVKAVQELSEKVKALEDA